jgi:hypothetical protein
MPKSTTQTRGLLAAWAGIVLLCIGLSIAAEQPTGPTSITNLSTEAPGVLPAYKLNTSGGTFTTLLINVTAQTYRWKAYAGNITGRLTLDDNMNYTIYDWSIATVSGQVYATRSATLISWQNIRCANETTVRSEEFALNISSSNDDSINRTFIAHPKIHDKFYAGTKYIQNNTCPSIATHVNNTAQNSTFQEVLLYDTSHVVYAGLLENGAKGFDNNYYDFQIIVPESGLEAQQAPTAYYFYVELV